jgi:hypothetical protein
MDQVQTAVISPIGAEPHSARVKDAERQKFAAAAAAAL